MHANNNVLDLIVNGLRSQPLLIIGRIIGAKVMASEGKPPKLKITMVSPAGYHDIWIHDPKLIERANSGEFDDGGDIVVHAQSATGAKAWGDRDDRGNP